MDNMEDRKYTAYVKIVAVVSLDVVACHEDNAAAIAADIVNTDACDLVENSFEAWVRDRHGEDAEFVMEFLAVHCDEVKEKEGLQ